MRQMYKAIDWQKPQRQSPAAIVILLMRTLWGLVKIVLPSIVLFLFNRKPESDVYFLMGMSGLGVVAIMLTLLRYWFYKFYILEGKLHIQTGWWQKKALAIPLKSIQAVHLEQNIWQQLFGVSRVSFDSAGSEQVEARIDALPVQKAELLKSMLLNEGKDLPADETESLPTPSLLKHIYTLSAWDILKLSLSANHIRAFFILLAFGIKFYDDVGQALDKNQKKAVQAYAEASLQQGIVFYAILIGMLAFVSILISAGRMLLKYYDFKLAETDKGWKVSHGLFTQQQKIIPLAKIQMIVYEANWVRRMLNFWMIDLHITGQDKKKAQSQLVLPVISLPQVLRLTESYLPDVPSGAGRQGISPAYWFRKVLWVGLPVSLSLFGLLWAFFSLQVSYWAGLVLVYATIHFYWWRKNFRWYMNEDGLVLCSGVWGRTYTLMAWDKLQQVHLLQSIYQRKKGLASIDFVTAGGVVELPYIDFQLAKQVVNRSLYWVESRQASWR